MALDFSLSDEQKQVQLSARSMLKKFEGRREQFRKMIFEEKKFPQEIWDAIAHILRQSLHSIADPKSAGV